MMDAKTIKSLSTRLEKAEALIREGAVFPIAGLAGYAVVRNGDGTQMYLVRFDRGHEHCTCPDFRHRQGAHGLPCKHILASQIAAGESPQPEPPAAAARVDTSAGVALLMGKVAA